MADHEWVLDVLPQLRSVVLVDPAAPLPGVRELVHKLVEGQNAQKAKVEKEEQEAIQRVLLQLGEVAAELQAHGRQRLQEMQQVAVELAIAIASRLIHERVEANEFGIEQLVQQAVEQLKTTQPVTVFLHPLDLELLHKRLGPVPLEELVDNKTRLLSDATVQRGNCLAESGEISVRLHIQEQLVAMRRHLLDALPEATLDRRRPLSAERPLKRFPDRRHTA